MYEFSIMVDVTNEQALYERALEVSLSNDSHLDAEAANDILKPDGVIDVGACLIMILDPGTLPGCEINDSIIESNR